MSRNLRAWSYSEVRTRVSRAKLVCGCSTERRARICRTGTVCKLNLRDMGATSGEVYSLLWIIERQVERPQGRAH